MNKNTIRRQGQEKCSREHDREREAECESDEEDLPSIQVFCVEIIIRHAKGQRRQ